MYEIELKAHVDDRKSVIEKLGTFAGFLQSVQKDDIYWAIHKNGEKIQARIRKETDLETSEKKIYLTYKRKENRIAENGKSYEVNDEKECEISDSSALEAVFADSGFEIALEKHKTVYGYQYGECHIELCTVPPLGDFLEIEILSGKNDEETVSEKRKLLLEVLRECGIPEEKIENRYYSEMLKGTQSK